MFAMPDLTHFKSGVKFGIGFTIMSLVIVWLQARIWALNKTSALSFPRL
jgi:hypothetical protein